MQESELSKRLTWAWPWYLLAAVCALIVGNLAPLSLRPVELGAFLLLATLVMLKERVPEVVLLPVALAVWILTRLPWPLWQTLFAGSALCLLVFASQFIWRVLPPVNLGGSPQLPARVLAIGGQIGITLALLLVYGGPGASVRDIQTGSLAVLVLVTLLLWLAFSQPRPTVRTWTLYIVGFLLSLLVSWELRILSGLSVDILLLPPASYLTVVAPFLLRDRTTPGSQRMGEMATIIGACGLLLPSLVLSNIAQGNVGVFPARLVSTLLLLAESLSLFTLGLLMRVRFFLLGGTALVVIGAIEALIYAVTQPQQTGVVLVWLALAVSGGALIGGAAFLALQRPKTQREKEAG